MTQQEAKRYTQKKIKGVNKTIDKPQDKLFKDLLSDKKDVAKFINEIIEEFKVNKKIKSEEIEKCSNSFIDMQYKSREADIVYRIKNTNIFFLIEHQSYMDNTMPKRMLDYGIEIIRNASKNIKTNNKYPKVFLIVLYTGSAKWTAKLEYEHIVDDVIEYKENGINAKYTVIDIHNYEKEELIKENNMIKNIMAIGKCKKAEEVKEIVKYLIRNAKSEEEQIKLKRVIKYILPKILNPKDVEILLKKIEKEEIDMFGMLEENLEKERMEIRSEGKKEGRREGKKEGKIEGITVGIKEATLKIAKAMLKREIPIEEIMQITEITEDELKLIEQD